MYLVTAWPYPDGTAEDRAKRVALSYRRALELASLDQLGEPLADTLAELDSRWQNHGATWVKPTADPLDLDEWLPAGQLAELLAIDPQRLRDWARRSRIRVIVKSGVRHYCVGDVVAYQRDRRVKNGA